MGATGLVVETINMAPEVEQHFVHALPAYIELVSISKSLTYYVLAIVYVD